MVPDTLKVHARAQRQLRRRHDSTGNPVLGNRHFAPHLLNFPSAKMPCFISYTYLTPERSLVPARPRVFCGGAIFSSRASASRTFNPASPLARTAFGHDESVAALILSSRESVSRFYPLSRRNTAANFFFEDRRPCLLSAPSFLLRVAPSSRHPFDSKRVRGTPTRGSL
jgi:hypothetical protein